jgi:hypothetical protein
MPYAAAADDDGYDNSSEELRQNKARPHKRHTHPERQQSPAAMNLDLLAAAASSPDLGAAADEEASAGIPAAAAAAGGRQRGRGYNTGRGRLGSGGSGNVLHGQEETSDAADGGAYVCEEEEGDGQDSDGEEHQSHSSKNRANNERVLSNRLAASRSYQRRKEEMLRLEHTHARLQVGGLGFEKENQLGQHVSLRQGCCACVAVDSTVSSHPGLMAGQIIAVATLRCADAPGIGSDSACLCLLCLLCCCADGAPGCAARPAGD